MGTVNELRNDNRKLLAEVGVRDEKISELELQITRHLDTIGARDRVIVALQGQEREQNLRMAVIHEQSYLALEELDRVATWVIQGEIPSRADGFESEQELKRDSGAAEMAEGPRLPEIDRVALSQIAGALESVVWKLGEVRNDPNLSVGKVRIQSAHTRLQGIVLDLNRIAEGGA